MSRVGPERRVRLARKVRLRFDAHSGKQMLLYPERGLELSDSAARIAELCREGLTASAIAARLAAAHPDQPAERISAEVMAFLQELDDRGLLDGEEPE